MPNLPESFLTRPIAHRALHDRRAGRIENSRAAIRAAVARGYGIEIDLQLSSDGEAMVFHDDLLDRLTEESGPVRKRTAAALGAIPLRDGGETIPTLPEILEIVAGQVPLLIEVKDQDGALGPDVGPLERRAARHLEHYAGPVALMSFNPHSVMACAEAAPDIPRGLTSCAFDDAEWSAVPADRLAGLAALDGFDPAGCSFISHHHVALASAPVAALAARGVKILCWTIRSPEEEEEARRIAHNITFESYLAPIDLGARDAK